MEERRTGGQEDLRTEGQKERTTEQQGDRTTGGQKDRTGGTMHWLTCITIDVNVLHPAVILLQLIIIQLFEELSCHRYFFGLFFLIAPKGRKRLLINTKAY